VRGKGDLSTRPRIVGADAGEAQLRMVSPAEVAVAAGLEIFPAIPDAPIVPAVLHEAVHPCAEGLVPPFIYGRFGAVHPARLKGGAHVKGRCGH